MALKLSLFPFSLKTKKQTKKPNKPQTPTLCLSIICFSILIKAGKEILYLSVPLQMN